MLLYTRGSPFSGTEGEEWDTWIGRFEARTAQLTESDKLHVLVGLLEGKALDICASLSEEKQQDYKAVKSILEKTFSSKVDELQAFAAFSQATRQPNESVQSFGERLKKLCLWIYHDQCDTNDQVVQTVVNRFICGLKDPWLQRKLFVDKPKTVDEAISKVTELHRQQEVIASLTPAPGSVEPQQACPVSNMGTRSRASTAWTQDGEQAGTSTGTTADTGAARVPCPNPAQRRPVGGGARPPIRCYGCGEMGHIRRFCPNTRPSPRQQQTNSTREQRAPWCLCCGEDGHWMAGCQHYQRLTSQCRRLSDREESRDQTPSDSYQPSQPGNW